jgi:diguanylate cyclase (GGDEF)-like protein
LYGFESAFHQRIAVGVPLNELSKLTDPSLWPLLELSTDGILLVAANPWRVTYVNPAAAEWLESAPADLVGRWIGEFFDKASEETVLSRLDEALDSEPSGQHLDLKLLLPSGYAREVAARFCQVVAGGSILVGIVLRNVPIEASAARIDPLTGLFDRSFLSARLGRLLQQTGPTASQFAVLFVDLNNFKDVNDRHGHVVGDRVLSEASNRLAACVRHGDWVVRYGGDEFVVLVEQLTEPADVGPIVDRINDVMAQPIEMPHGPVTLSVSVGAAIGPGEYPSPEDVIAAADRAMYAAKRGE